MLGKNRWRRFWRVRCASASRRIFLFGATALGRSLAPSLAARLGTDLTADGTGLEIDPERRLLIQTRPAFGGNLMPSSIWPG